MTTLRAVLGSGPKLQVNFKKCKSNASVYVLPPQLVQRCMLVRLEMCGPVLTHQQPFTCYNRNPPSQQLALLHCLPHTAAVVSTLMLRCCPQRTWKTLRVGSLIRMVDAFF
jgi:hypothetical protein